MDARVMAIAVFAGCFAWNVQEVNASPLPTPIPGHTILPRHHLRAPHSAPTWQAPSLTAIVQLEGLEIPTPKISGQAIIPLQPYGRTQVFTLMLNLAGQQYPFLLDTGATTTMLAPPIVKQLKLMGRPIPNQRLGFAVAGDSCPNMNAQLFPLPTFSMQQVRVESLQGLMFNHTVMPPGLAGVLGMDVWQHFNLRIDPKTLQLHLRPPRTLTAREKTQAIPLQKKAGVMLAQLIINHQRPFTVLVDTGAGSTFIAPHVAQQVGLDVTRQPPLQIQGFCGLEDARRSQLASVQLGPHEQTHLDTIILSSSILKVLGVDGILGQNFLNHYQQSWHFGSTDDTQGYLILMP